MVLNAIESDTLQSCNEVRDGLDWLGERSSLSGWGGRLFTRICLLSPQLWLLRNVAEEEQWRCSDRGERLYGSSSYGWRRLAGLTGDFDGALNEPL